MAATAPAEEGPRTVIVRSRENGQRMLIVEIHPELSGTPSEHLVQALARRLFYRNVLVGLFVTPEWTYVVRDRRRSMAFDSAEFTIERIETPRLLASARLPAHPTGSAFVEVVQSWLERVALAWNVYLPDEAFGAMVPEVIGALYGADFELWDDVLEGMDGRE
jgi:hypothetical protein